MKKKKKFRVSLLIKIGLLLLVAMVVSLGILMLVNAKQGYLLNFVAAQTKDVANAATTAAMVSLRSEEELEKLYEDEALREEVHTTFRFICKRTGLLYLYLYTVDEEGVRHYIISAAAEDDNDEKINAQYGFGDEERDPLHDSEKEALSGQAEGGYDFITNESGHICMYILPVISQGRVIALIGADYSVEHIGRAMRKMRLILVLAFFCVFGVTLHIAMIMIYGFVLKPISAISASMKHFLKDQSALPRTGRWIFDDEISDIEESFSQMAGDITQYISDIRKLDDERAQDMAQMDAARKIQEGIVPEELNLSVRGCEIYGCEHPAKKVGGDFYDIFRLDGEQVCVVVGDISGKGLSAALFMVMVRTAIRENLKAGSSLADTLNTVNHELCLTNPENMFATVFAAVLDSSTGTLRYANAGHNAPLLLGEEPQYLSVDPGMALGIFDDQSFREASVTLKDSEGILIYTDGVTESVNAHREQFGEERLKEEARKQCRLAGVQEQRRGDAAKEQDRKDPESGSAKVIVDSVLSCVSQFSKGLEQFDDITCVALVFDESWKEGEQLSLDMASFQSVKQMILSAYGCTDYAKQMILACEEIFSNIVNYSEAGNIFFYCSKRRDSFFVTFSDDGIPFDPTSGSLPEKDFNDLDTGGMGILLARSYSRNMYYRRAGDRNTLTLEFDKPRQGDGSFVLA